MAGSIAEYRNARRLVLRNMLISVTVFTLLATIIALLLVAFSPTAALSLLGSLFLGATWVLTSLLGALIGLVLGMLYSLLLTPHLSPRDRRVLLGLGVGLALLLGASLALFLTTTTFPNILTYFTVVLATNSPLGPLALIGFLGAVAVTMALALIFFVKEKYISSKAKKAESHYSQFEKKAEKLLSDKDRFDLFYDLALGQVDNNERKAHPTAIREFFNRVLLYQHAPKISPTRLNSITEMQELLAVYEQKKSSAALELKDEMAQRALIHLNELMNLPNTPGQDDKLAVLVFCLRLLKNIPQAKIQDNFYKAMLLAITNADYRGAIASIRSSIIFDQDQGIAKILAELADDGERTFYYLMNLGLNSCAPKDANTHPNYLLGIAFFSQALNCENNLEIPKEQKNLVKAMKEIAELCDTEASSLPLLVNHLLGRAIQHSHNLNMIAAEAPNGDKKNEATAEYQEALELLLFCINIGIGLDANIESISKQLVALLSAHKYGDVLTLLEEVQKKATSLLPAPPPEGIGFGQITEELGAADCKEVKCSISISASKGNSKSKSSSTSPVLAASLTPLSPSLSLSPLPHSNSEKPSVSSISPASSPSGPASD